MPVFQPVYNGQLTTVANPNTTIATKSPNRGLTPGCWLGIDVAAKDPSLGFVHVEDYKLHPDPASYLLTQKGSVGQVLLDETEEYGVWQVDCNSITADQGINLQMRGMGIKPTEFGVIAFETRVRLDDIGTRVAGNGYNAAIGLCNWDTSFLASGTVDTSGNNITDYAMFISLSSGTTINSQAKWSFQMTRLGSGNDVDLQKDIADIVDGDVTPTAWVKLGFRAEVGKSLELFVNGAKVSSSSILPPIVPDAIVYPTFVCESEGTVDPILMVDWFAVGAA